MKARVGDQHIAAGDQHRVGIPQFNIVALY
jgi:hypothetical protein